MSKKEGRVAGKETAESTTEKDGERKSKGEKRHPFSRGSIDASASFVDFRAENADALEAARGVVAKGVAENTRDGEGDKRGR